MKLPHVSASPFQRSFSTRVTRLNAKSVPIFRASLRYTKKQLNYDLEQKIDLELKMQDGTKKLLVACKELNQIIEASKSLLTSDIRLTELRNELQKRKNSPKSIPKKSTTECGKASVSEIRIPLIWKDTDYFKNKGDHRRFAVFCLVQVGCEVYDTIIVNVDRNCTDICFEDVFTFNDVKPDLQVKLFIYSRLLHEDLSIASSHKKFTQRISSSLSRSLGRRVQQLKDDFNPETGPKFYLVASSTTTLKDASDAVKTHDLSIESVDKNQELPLFGHFCCRFAVKPDCQQREYLFGLVSCHQLKSKHQEKEETLWCSLKGFKMSFWLAVSDESKTTDFSKLKNTLSTLPPDMIIPINSNTKFGQEVDRLIVTNMDASFAFKSHKISLLDWLSCLNTVKENFLLWQPISEYNMELAQRDAAYFLRSTARRPGALYDEIEDYDAPIENNNNGKINAKPSKMPLETITDEVS